MPTVSKAESAWDHFLGRRVHLACRSGLEIKGAIFNTRDGVLKLDVNWRKDNSEARGKNISERAIAVPVSNVAYVEEED
jgi:hypothetical protein